jgi:hypothetical protein
MNEELEMFMANLLQERSPQNVQSFIDEISEGGVDQEEVDTMREVVMRTINDPSTYSAMVGFLTRNGIIDDGDAPAQYDAGFVLTMLGLVGIAQSLVGGQRGII